MHKPEIKFYIPSKLKSFLYDYNHSKFIECNRLLSERQIGTVKINIQKLTKILNSLKCITSTLERMRKDYTLLAGTLLGILKIFFRTKL